MPRPGKASSLQAAFFCSHSFNSASNRSSASATVNRFQALKRHFKLQNLPLLRRVSLDLNTRKVFLQSTHCRKTWPTSGYRYLVIALQLEQHSLGASSCAAHPWIV